VYLDAGTSKHVVASGTLGACVLVLFLPDRR